MEYEFGDNDYGPVSWNSLTKKPDVYPPREHRHNASDIDGLESGGGGGSVTDTGARIVMSNEDDGWSGAFLLHRVGNAVSIAAANISGYTVSDVSTPLLYIPDGYRPIAPVNFIFVGYNNASLEIVTLAFDPSNFSLLLMDPTPPASDYEVAIPFVTYFTADDIPETLPGTSLSESL